MEPYLNLLQDVLHNGDDRTDRTGTGTKSLFGRQVRYDLSKGFPCLTTKNLHLKSIIHELLWFLSGDTNIAYLKKHKVKIWDAWADEEGNLGPVYGQQWRAWKTQDGHTIDQIQQLIHKLQHDPHSRRHLISAWNVGQLDQMALPPCHLLFQFYVQNIGSDQPRLSCQLYQRSADIFLGVPFNIASYALLTHMIAQVCGYGVGEFIHSIGDLHLYHNHIEQAQLQLTRQTKPLPTLLINPEKTNIDDFCYDDFELQNYDPHPHIKAPVAV